MNSYACECIYLNSWFSPHTSYMKSNEFIYDGDFGGTRLPDVCAH